MRGQHRRSVMSAPHSTLFVSVGCVALVLFLSSCSDNFSVQREDQQTNESWPPVSYSIICINHGDGDYLYHDAGGNEHKADEEALEGVTLAAVQNPHAEVFIFHQRPKYHFLFFFPLPDGEFVYYRNGRLIAHESYWRGNEQSRFEPEVELYRRFHTESRRAVVKIFLYCGHEIPEFGGAGYDASSPDRAFTVHDLQAGLQGFTGSSTKFDLMVLSTCFGGTPYTVGALGSFARYIIASPDNLHLSYFDFRALNRLDSSLRADSVSAFAQKFATKSFDRLARNVQTSVSVAVYDADSVKQFIGSVHSEYDRTLTVLNGETPARALMTEHCDCADLPAYALPTISDGVDILYRPARFGRSKGKQNHSGWECWKVPEPLRETSQISVPGTQ
jgi:Clostripain family